jgi:hypothetical protein
VLSISVLLTRTAGLLHDDKGRRVEPETSRDTAMTHDNKEARILKQEPPCDTAILQPGEEAMLVEPERPRGMVQPNDTSILQPSNLMSSAEMLHQAISGIVPAYSRKLPLPGLFSLARKS